VKYLVDTDRVIDYLKGNEETVELLLRLFPEGLAISLITYGEVYEGIQYGRRPNTQEEAFKRFLKGVEVVGLDRPTMRLFATLRGRLRKSGEIISDPDLLIAATALERSLTIVTGNAAHFSRIKELRRLER
jgi:predicted nucleic acid-binding protein